MAASNDNQGLKIAVAALVMLVFILGVTNYFAFSSYSQATARAEDANKKAGESENKARTALTEAGFLKTAIGYGTIEDLDSTKAAMTKDIQRITNEIQALGNETMTSISEVQKAGEPDPKLDELKQVGLSIVNAFVSEPSENKVYVKSLDRVKDILLNQSRLLRELSLDYRKLRVDLTAANSVNAVEVAKVSGAKEKANQEKQDELAKIKTELQSLYDQINTLQTSDKDKTNTITDLTNKLTDAQTKYETFQRDTRRTLVDMRDRLSRNDTELGKSIGRITYVDSNRGEVRLSVNRADGAKPLMTLTVFDRDARAVPSEKPKGTIQIVSVGDPALGQNDSLGRIVQVKDPANPIRYNDQLYSAAFLPDYPQRFGLLGKIDVNRDGRDDRADLIRLIEQAGGLVEYDLPPPGVDRTPGRLAVERAFAKMGEPVPPITGRASGRITPQAKAYIIDDRITLRGDAVRESLTPEAEAYNKERTEAVKEARLNGVPPLPIERLLTYLGYTPPVNGVNPGSVEFRNRDATKQLTKPRTNQGGATTTPPVSPDPAAPAPDAGMPK